MDEDLLKYTFYSLQPTLVVVAVVVVVIVAVKKKKKNNGNESNTNEEVPVKVQYCEKCGKPMTADDVFCSSCGTANTSREIAK